MAPAMENIEWLSIPLGPNGPEFPTNWLTSQERARRDRFQSMELAKRWEQTRTSLRFVIGSILHKDPRLIAFEIEAHGRPYVHTLPSERAFHFSLSHTQDLAVIAWSRSTLVGIDVELYRDVAWNELARSALTAAEFKHGQSIPPENQSRYFLECWTAKEALLKGLGIGIAAGTNTVDLDLKSPLADAKIHSFDASLSPWIVEKTKLQFPKILDPKAWRLASIPVGDRHIGAIAVHASSITLHQRSLDEL